MKNQKIVLISLVVIALFFLLVGVPFLKKEIRLNHLTLYGNIDIRQVELGFRVSGRLEKLHFEEGDRVKKGELVAELDRAPYEANARQSTERVRALESSSKYAQDQLRRRDELKGSRSVSEEEYQQSYFNHKSLDANLKEAKAMLDASTIQLDDTSVYAPSEGTILTRVREPGSVVKAGEPVYVLSISSPVWARAYVSEIDLGLVRPGMPAEVRTDTPENPVYKGHIGFISPVAEFTPKSVETTDLRTNLVYQIRVVIDNPDQGLRQGMPVTINIKHDR